MHSSLLGSVPIVTRTAGSLHLFLSGTRLHSQMVVRWYRSSSWTQLSIRGRRGERGGAVKGLMHACCVETAVGGALGVWERRDYSSSRPSVTKQQSAARALMTKRVERWKGPPASCRPLPPDSPFPQPPLHPSSCLSPTLAPSPRSAMPLNELRGRQSACIQLSHHVGQETWS